MPKAKKQNSNSNSNAPSPHRRAKSQLPIPVAAMVCVALAAAVYIFIAKPTTPSPSSITIPATNKTAQPQLFEVQCSSDQRCTASNRCGRAIQDDFISSKDAEALRDMMRKAVQHGGGGGSGGPTIFDLSTGAITYKDKFISLYAVFEEMKATNEDFKGIWSLNEYELLVGVVEKVHDFIVHMFGVKGELYLSGPLFFSFIEANRVPQRANDEYWHKHIDRIAYGSFDYTALVYLSDFNHDFEGGEFVFCNTEACENRLILEPVRGRVNAFTSGSENVHFVDKVTKGERYALTIAFTCDKKAAIPANINTKINTLLNYLVYTFWSASTVFLNKQYIVLQGVDYGLFNLIH